MAIQEFLENRLIKLLYAIIIIIGCLWVQTPIRWLRSGMFLYHIVWFFLYFMNYMWTEITFLGVIYYYYITYIRAEIGYVDYDE